MELDGNISQRALIIITYNLNGVVIMNIKQKTVSICNIKKRLKKIEELLKKQIAKTLAEDKKVYKFTLERDHLLSILQSSNNGIK